MRRTKHEVKWSLFHSYAPQFRHSSALSFTSIPAIFAVINVWLLAGNSGFDITNMGLVFPEFYDNLGGGLIILARGCWGEEVVDLFAV